MLFAVVLALDPILHPVVEEQSSNSHPAALFRGHFMALTLVFTRGLGDKYSLAFSLCVWVIFLRASTFFF